MRASLLLGLLLALLLPLVGDVRLGAAKGGLLLCDGEKGWVSPSRARARDEVEKVDAPRDLACLALARLWSNLRRLVSTFASLSLVDGSRSRPLPAAGESRFFGLRADFSAMMRLMSACLRSNSSTSSRQLVRFCRMATSESARAARTWTRL